MPATIVPLLELDSPVLQIAGVQAKHAALLAKLGVTTVRDLLFHVPFGWESFGGVTPIRALRPGSAVTVIGRVEWISAKVTRYKRRSLSEMRVTDGSGTLQVAFFNQPWLVRAAPRGSRVALAGVVKGPRIEMVNPHLEVLGDGGPDIVGELMPKYHTTAGLTSRKIAEFVRAVLPLARRLEDPLPASLLERHGLMGISEAIRSAHRPESEARWQEARRRLVFQELLELQTAFIALRREQAVERATPVPYRQPVIEAFKAGLGFELTRAQRRATWEVYQDMEREAPMNRLLNGDVGSGKTAVAAAAAAMAHAAGLQTVVMAPTEILARQHLQKFRAYLEPSFPGLTVELLVSGLPAAERRRVLMAAGSGHCSVLVGTHALIEDRVELADMGLAVVDEQHRFGTRQRELLRAKAGRGRPHFLAMTATPIPRTLALALYGEMAISVLDELPPGRTPVATAVITPDQREQAYELVRSEVRAGRQVFVICPLIEESEKLEARAAEAEFERLRTEVFPDLRLSLVHGRMKKKDSVMAAFREGEADILVATSVIEVGVDVPNATVMLVEGAERFGLAQLHQFRGRVGRGALQSHCLLLSDDPAAAEIERLRLMSTIHDGFQLADADMRIRGTGELMGPRQHGISDQAMRALGQPQLLSEAREAAESLLADDPDLTGHPLLRQAVRWRLEHTAIS